MAERHPEQPARLCLCWSERSLQARLREGKRPAASVSEECAHRQTAAAAQLTKTPRSTDKTPRSHRCGQAAEAQERSLVAAGLRALRPVRIITAAAAATPPAAGDAAEEVEAAAAAPPRVFDASGGLSAQSTRQDALRLALALEGFTQVRARERARDGV
jgi:hypothetical protein